MSKSNGEHVFATHIGTVNLTDGLILTKVLYIPNFSVNLISANRLTSELSCCLISLDKFCYIQDLTQWRTIGVAKITQVLYHFLQNSVSSSVSSQFSSCNVGTKNLLFYGTVVWAICLNLEYSSMYHMSP